MRDPLRLGVNGFSSSAMRASAVSGRINLLIPSGEEQVFVREIAATANQIRLEQAEFAEAEQ
jgi:hypothetical protein